MNRLAGLWYKKQLTWQTLLLLPLACLFRLVVFLRRQCYRYRLFKSNSLPVPVVIVGNITVGGTGKTPLVVWLVNALLEQGYRPGVVSRGYGASSHAKPFFVTRDSSVQMAGDEPLLIAKHTGVPVAIFPNRVQAARELLASTDCNIIISDDGLQHYRLARDVEIAVVDARRGVGNGSMLPAGPLREPIARLHTVDFVVVNTAEDDVPHSMKLTGSELQACHSDLTKPLSDLTGQSVHAVAGIGHPARFFDSLRSSGIHVIEHAFPDHYAFQADDLHFNDELPIVMTEKDALKCMDMAISNCWYLPVQATLKQDFKNDFFAHLNKVLQDEKTMHVAAHPHRD